MISIIDHSKILINTKSIDLKKVINYFFILIVFLNIPLKIVNADNSITPPFLNNNGRHWVVWYGNDNRVHRQQVNADDYLELRTSLNQVREEDRERLKQLANEYLKIDLKSVFTDLDARREAFLIGIFDFGASSSLLGTALTAAETALSLKNSDKALVQVQETLN